MADERQSITLSIRGWREEMADTRSALQKQLESVDCNQEDSKLAANVRGLISELRALTASIESAEKFFDQS